MKPALIVLRHGNTFEAGEPPRRVGARTDIPLTEKGREQAARAGEYLLAQGLVPAEIVTSPLLRTKKTARIVSDILNVATVTENDSLREMDYGPDENQPEEAVLNRIGMEALQAWENTAQLPPGWVLDRAKVTECWNNLAERAVRNGPVLAVTSNGIARFALELTGEPLGSHPLKLSTGALGFLEYDGTAWRIAGWNISA